MFCFPMISLLGLFPLFFSSNSLSIPKKNVLMILLQAAKKKKKKSKNFYTNKIIIISVHFDFRNFDDWHVVAFGWFIYSFVCLFVWSIWFCRFPFICLCGLFPFIIYWFERIQNFTNNNNNFNLSTTFSCFKVILFFILFNIFIILKEFFSPLIHYKIFFTIHILNTLEFVCLLIL